MLIWQIAKRNLITFFRIWSHVLNPHSKDILFSLSSIFCSFAMLTNLNQLEPKLTNNKTVSISNRKFPHNLFDQIPRAISIVLGRKKSVARFIDDLFSCLWSKRSWEPHQIFSIPNIIRKWRFWLWFAVALRILKNNVETLIAGSASATFPCLIYR